MPEQHLQPTLEGLEYPREPHAFDNRRSLAGLLTPGRMAINVSEYADVIPLVELASTDNFRKDLIDIPVRSPYGVNYLDVDLHRPVTVAMTAEEYNLVPRSVRHLAQSATSRSVAYRKGIGEPVGKAQEVGERAAGHSLDAAAERSEQYLTALTDQEQLLQKFRQASHGSNRGLSLFGTELKTRMQFETYRTTILGNMLSALALQREWTTSQYERAQRTIDLRLVYPREGNMHLDYFESLTGLLLDYNHVKQNVFRSRVYQIRRQLGKVTLQ